MGGHVACLGKIRISYIILVEKSEGKGPLARPRSRGESNVRIDLRDKVWESIIDWMHLSQDRGQ
jgi:hypothetical protein